MGDVNVAVALVTCSWPLYTTRVPVTDTALSMARPEPAGLSAEVAYWTKMPAVGVAPGPPSCM